MGNIKEGLRWLDQAKADLKTARDCLEDGNYCASAFFSQQSAKNALKGFLYSKGFRALVTHSVVELLEKCRSLEGSFNGLEEYSKELDRHYIGSRQPNFYPSGAHCKFYTADVAKRCLSYAESILKEAKRFLQT